MLVRLIFGVLYLAICKICLWRNDVYVLCRILYVIILKSAGTQLITQSNKNSLFCLLDVNWLQNIYNTYRQAPTFEGSKNLTIYRFIKFSDISMSNITVSYLCNFCCNGSIVFFPKYLSLICEIILVYIENSFLLRQICPHRPGRNSANATITEKRRYKQEYETLALNEIRPQRYFVNNLCNVCRDRLVFSRPHIYGQFGRSLRMYKTIQNVLQFSGSLIYSVSFVHTNFRRVSPNSICLNHTLYSHRSLGVAVDALSRQFPSGPGRFYTVQVGLQSLLRTSVPRTVP